MNVQLVEGEKYYICIRNLIANAEKEITIAAFEFDCGLMSTADYGYAIARALIEKGQSMPHIRVLLNSSSRNNRMYFVNKQTADFLTEGGIQVIRTNPSITLHLKLAIFDRSLTLLGSHNLSNRSIKRCKELSVLIDDERIANECHEYLKYITGKER